MRFSEFERIARNVWDDIPDEYRRGVDGLIIEQEALPSSEHDKVFTLGECVTEEYPSQYGGPDTIRSAVVLYYGSFRELANGDAGFDWATEIHETLMHELKHHLEALASTDELGDYDYAVEQNFKRQSGESFDPLFFRAGELLSPNVYEIAGDVFVESLTLTTGPTALEFIWKGREHNVRLGRARADITFVTLENIPVDGEFVLVRVVKRGVLATLRSAFGGGTTAAFASARVES
jgi:predicted Zn-dependent protease with MMP-like domain